MKKLLLLLLCCLLIGSAPAVVSETQTFDGNPGDPLPTGWWDYYDVDNVNYGDTDYDGSGALNLDTTVSTDARYFGPATYGTGDFDLDVQFSNISLGGQYETLYFKVVDDGGYSNQMGFKTWAGGLYVENLAWDPILGWVSGQSTLVATLPSAVTKLDMAITWRDTAGIGGVWTMDYDLGDGTGMQTAASVPYTIDATAGRFGFVWAQSFQDYQIYGGYEHCATADLDAGLDYYSITAVVPEPATMVLLGLGSLLLRRKRA